MSSQPFQLQSKHKQAAVANDTGMLSKPAGKAKEPGGMNDGASHFLSLQAEGAVNESS